MSIRPNNLPPIQDMPPPGGYPEINTARSTLKPRGPKGWQLWAGTSALIMFGFYRMGQGNIERNQQRMQERKVRYALAPLLQAEADREYMQRELENLKKEAEVMRDVPGWKVGRSPYNSDKWMPRAVQELRRDLK